MEAPRRRPRVPSVATVLLVVAVSFGALLAVTPRAAAITYVRGPIAVDTTWGLADSVYVITQSVTVLSGATLTILAGTTVRVDPGRNLFVEGRLVADGTAGNRITWSRNSTIALMPPVGVQFNVTGNGSVSWSTFDQFDRPLVAMDTSPSFTRDTITGGSSGIALIRSSAFVADNTIAKAQTGIFLSESNAQVLRNSIDSIATGIQALTSGTPHIANNVVSNVTAGFAVGIYIGSIGFGAGASADLWWNTVRNVQGARGPNGLIPGSPGSPGGSGVGIFVGGCPKATLVGNTIDQIWGGRGGDGVENPGSTGGAGAAGGGAAAILLGGVPSVSMTGNIISNIYGARGGAGGGGGTPSTVTGGDGGAAGGAAGIEDFTSSAAASWTSNSINGVTGGVGGSGGDGSGPDGRGANGGEAAGIVALGAMNGDAWGNFIMNIRGGPGGNSTALGLGNNHAGDGGDAAGIGLTAASGSSQLRQNTVWTVTSGAGGRGANAGKGGNATGAYLIGNADGAFNATSTTGNHFMDITGGVGGVGTRFGGAGGGALGFGAGLVTPTMAGNYVQRIRGGAGGDALDLTDGGRGGDATGATIYLDASGWSSLDLVDTIAKGAAGNGPPAQTSTAAGWNLVGNASFTTVMTIENGTLTSTGDYDLIVNDFVTGTTINTSLSESRLVMATFGTLTVKNFLGVHVYWPNGVSPVPGASILVEDEGTPVWNFASPTGLESWLLVTDRVYEGAIPARENRTDVTVTYLAYNFASDPRSVDMSVGNTQPFVMVDRTPPSATTSPLPTYENALTFTIPYTASDGNGVGIGNVTLWWRQGGGWTPYVTQPGGPTGTFSFTASSGDGTYEFAATADDLAGNQEANPNTNESWTIVDTVRPGSHVNPQPTWHNTATFLVSWGPDNGVTDIATYEIQYNHAGAGWTPWMVVTASVTSAMFTANPAWGVYEFRSKARDVAGNYEIPPAGNDTWTIVDTEPPGSNVLALPTYETSLTFPVSWDRVGDAYDIATFRIEVKDNAGAWSVWIASTPNRTENFAGVDGHTYQFRSIATDYAGNVEPTPSGNDTWTTVDVTAPDSAVAGLPQYTTSTSWTLSWGPVAGTTDIVSYTIQYSDNGGAWTSVPGAVGVTATTILFALGADAHTFAFRALATDRAGNVEAAPPTNDTWTLVDTTRPFVVVSAPRGSGTNTTPLIVITFSEPMNRASVQAAFSITPDINGAFSWTADSRTMTFIPARALQASTDYFVAIDSSAKDVAGNTMQTAHTFQFTTAAPIVPPATSGGVGDWWWLIAVIVAAVAGSLFVAMRLLRGRATPEPIAAAKKEGPATIDDVFLLYHDGILIKHETRRLKPDIDTDILSGMLTAVQSFVKDSFRTEDGELDELTFGAMHILIARGKWLILAAMVQGDGTVAMRGQIEKCVQDMEANQGPAIEAWDGNMTFAKVLSPYIKKLIRGDYA